MFEKFDKVLVLGDTHMNKGALKRASKFAKKHDCDAIIQVGDFGFFPRANPNYGKYQTIPTIWLDGNHEDHEALKRFHHTNFYRMFPNLWYANRGTTAQMGNTDCMFVGGAYSIDKQYRKEGWDWFKEETLREHEFQRIMNYDGNVDVLFCHDCPTDGIPRGKTAFPAGLAHREKLQHIVDKFRPKFCIYGHWHLHEVQEKYIRTYVCLDCDHAPYGNAMMFDMKNTEILEIVTI